LGVERDGDTEQREYGDAKYDASLCWMLAP
jgi:hypothetical protein